MITLRAAWALADFKKALGAKFAKVYTNERVDVYTLLSTTAEPIHIQAPVYCFDKKAITEDTLVLLQHQEPDDNYPNSPTMDYIELRAPLE